MLNAKGNKPEVWMLSCLRCLEPANGDERYLLSIEDGFQWMLRYTPTETRENMERKCMSTCGEIYWVDETD